MKGAIFLLIVIVFSAIFYYSKSLSKIDGNDFAELLQTKDNIHESRKKEFNDNDNNNKYDLSNEYRKYDKAIFVVGIPGSGTTLMKTILDVSDKMNCVHETKFVPAVLKMRKDLLKRLPRKNPSFLSYYNISHDAIRLFIIKIIEKGDPGHEILCAKDPGTIYNIDYLAELFSNVRIIVMIRDGRGSSLSEMTRKKKNDQNTFYNLISTWNYANKQGYEKCMKIGPKNCLMVKYEDLVTKTEKTIRKVLEFVNIEFDEKFLHHEQQKTEVYSFKNQTSKKIYQDKLRSWENENIKYDLSYLKRFEMFEKLGYEL